MTPLNVLDLVKDEIPQGFTEKSTISIGFIIDISRSGYAKIKNRLIDWLADRKGGDTAFVWPGEMVEAPSCVAQVQYKKLDVSMHQVVSEVTQTMRSSPADAAQYVVYITDQYDKQHAMALQKLNKRFDFLFVGDVDPNFGVKFQPFDEEFQWVKRFC